MKFEIIVFLDQDFFNMFIVKVFNVKMLLFIIFFYYKFNYVKMIFFKNILQVILIKY